MLSVKKLGKYFLRLIGFAAIISVPYFFTTDIQVSKEAEWRKLNFPYLNNGKFLTIGDSTLFIKSDYGIYRFIDYDQGFRKVKFNGLDDAQISASHLFHFAGKLFLNVWHELFRIEPDFSLTAQYAGIRFFRRPKIFFTSDNFIFFGSEVGGIERLDLENNESEKLTDDTGEFVLEQGVAMNDSLLYLRSDDGKILFINIIKKKLDSLSIQPDEFSSLLFIDSRKNLLSFGEKGMVSVYSSQKQKWKNIVSLPLEFGESIVSVFETRNKLIRAGTSSGKLFEFSLNSSSFKILENLQHVGITSFTNFQEMIFSASFAGVEVIASGGVSKTILKLPNTFDDNAVVNMKTFNEDEAYLMLLNGALHKTTNLGKNWEFILPPINNILAGDFYANDSLMILLGVLTRNGLATTYIRHIDKRNSETKVIESDAFVLRFINGINDYSLAYGNFSFVKIDFERGKVIELFSEGWIKYAHKFKDGKILLGSSSGLFESSDDGKNWKQILDSATVPSINHIYEFDDGSFLVAASDEGCLFSNDGGKSFIKKDKGLAAANCYKILENSKNQLIILSNRGIFLSENKGESWDLVYAINDPFVSYIGAYGGSDGKYLIANHRRRGLVYISLEMK